MTFHLQVEKFTPLQGSKKPPSSRPGQVDFPFGQATFSPSLPDRQGPRQAVRRLNFWQRFWEEKVRSTPKGIKCLDEANGENYNL